MSETSRPDHSRPYDSRPRNCRPHRIRLSSTWSVLTENPTTTDGIGIERNFHTPSNLSSDSRIFLCLSTIIPPAHAILNDLQLDLIHHRVLGQNPNAAQSPDEGQKTIAGDPQANQTSEIAPENSQKIDYHWDITGAIRSRNHFVLLWPSTQLPTQTSLPWFDLWLEIYDSNPHDSNPHP